MSFSICTNYFYFNFKLKSLFRDYIDRMQNNRKGRIRVISERFSDEIKAPTLASRWTCASYEGRLKDAVTEACSDQDKDKNGVEDQKNDQEGENDQGGENEEKEENENEEGGENKNEEGGENRSENVNISDDEYLKMDDD